MQIFSVASSCEFQFSPSATRFPPRTPHFDVNRVSFRVSASSLSFTMSQNELHESYMLQRDNFFNFKFFGVANGLFISKMGKWDPGGVTGLYFFGNDQERAIQSIRNAMDEY